MKTKPYLLATAGSTVDGRKIDDKMLEEMASSYNPKTYGARLNIEHIRGVSGDGPFRAFGDVLELSVGEVDVDFNGKTEKRKALYGVFDVTDDAKKLNGASQKVYPSIEIEPNFGGKGFAYLMGCALTDSPASIATDRLQFNRHVPGSLTVSGETAAALEYADPATTDSGNAFLGKFTALLDGFAARFSSEKPQVLGLDPAPGTDSTQAFDFSQMRPLLEEMTTAFSTAIGGLRTEMRDEIDGLGVKFKKLEDQAEQSPSTKYRARPPADGGAGDFSGIF